MDEEPEYDPREHDWRFDLPIHSGEREQSGNMACFYQPNTDESEINEPRKFDLFLSLSPCSDEVGVFRQPLNQP
jgi:hypothetical protein